MAYVVSSIFHQVDGNVRVVHLNVVADSAEATIQVPGITKVISLMYNRIAGTASATCVTIKENQGSTGTVIAGALGISGFVANTYRFVVYGAS